MQCEYFGELEGRKSDMALSLKERIETLKARQEKVLPTDMMAEAGRKVLLAEFIKLLQHEEGSRSGADVEDVHDMRVAIRRMRSLFRLLAPYYKVKDVQPFRRGLQRLGWALGDVRDLDVLIDNLRAFQLTLDADDQADLQETIDDLDQRRVSARDELIGVLDSKPYRRFLKAFTEFSTTSIEKKSNGQIAPSQIRHLLPSMIYDRLAAVRAYEDVLAEADSAALHALRIEFKRLRYTVSLFEDVLGSTIEEFIDELKKIQDCLGQINDAATARIRLDAVLEDSAGHYSDALNSYIDHLEAERTGQLTQLETLWERFNSRKVQQKLSTAVLALR
jgi:CHAD domain-containing protein